jgi:hypothetical protein
MNRIFPICLLIFLHYFSVCSQNTNKELKENISEKPTKVSICELKGNPSLYNHKLIEITSFVSFGFEDFTLGDPTCDSKQLVWLEYGGTNNSGTMYCCGVTAERSRPQQLIVENISISLVVDEKFKTFDRIIHRSGGSIVYATIRGRFFSGKKTVFPGGTVYAGYGHFGIASLLAINQIVDVDSDENKGLDYQSSAEQPNINKIGHGYKFLEEENALEMQKQAENGEASWRFDNPEKVASNYLANLLKIDEKSFTDIKQTKQSQGRFVYSWKNIKTKTPYMLVVSRPYWLSFYAKDSKKVAWIVIDAYEVT